MSSLNLKNIYKVYPSGVTAVTDFNLDIEDKEFIVFVGPSGCGKSTTLRMIAGLEEISSGELYIDGVLVNNRAPKDRDIAMVFQNYALYPHMTVYDNMAFGLKLRKMPKPQIDQRVKEAARILGIEMYLSRKPKALSGGQRQRVALGRAIVREPKVFLLDEPLSNLDAKLRSQMRTEITKLHNRLATTFIYVTHDQVEAMTMGTRIVVMKDGFMQQVDTPINLYDHPINQFVAGFIGTPQMNFFSGKLTGSKGAKGKVYLEFGLEKIALPKEKVDLICNLDKYLNTDREIVFGIRPEDLHDEEAWVNDSKNPSIEVKVDVVEALGSETLLYCKTRSEQVPEDEESIKSIVDDVSNLTAKVDSRSSSKAGDNIKIAIDIIHCHLFDKETEVTILARDEENKAEIEALQAKREEEEAAKAAAAAEKLAAEEAKAAAEAEKQRLKMEKKLAKKNKVEAPAEEVAAPAEEPAAEEEKPAE
ncbi:MAG: sn-glycerol-3-phosphate ABC transporter ATP-binding protein UgpC [Clostridia bacterium]|nr:sn-glycerol-3-phosphate ABC transporter ATP-binding protein UgpC [Clostridia bacterium]